MIKQMAIGLFTRIGIVYILAVLVIFAVCDEKYLIERTQFRRLNDSKPDFKGLIEYRDNKKIADFSSHRRYLDMVIRYVPEDAASRLILGYIELSEGRAVNALPLFKRSGELNPGLFWNNYNLGYLYFDQGDYAAAVPPLLMAVRMTPQIIGQQMFGSIIYRQIFATEGYDTSIEKESLRNLSAAYTLLLESLLRSKRYNEMLILAESAIGRKELPNQDAFYFYAGLAFMQFNQMDKAFAAIIKSVELKPENPLAFYCLSRIYSGLGKDQEASYFLLKYASAKAAGKAEFPYLPPMPPGF